MTDGGQTGETGGAAEQRTEARLSDAEARPTDAQGRLSDAEARPTDAQGRLSDAQARLSDAQARLSDAQGRLSDAEARPTDAQARLSDAQARLSDAEARLSDAEAAVLAYEGRSWPGPGAKERAIREGLGLSPVRYYQLLNALMDDPRALAHAPGTVNRLRRIREAQRARR